MVERTAKLSKLLDRHARDKKDPLPQEKLDKLFEDTEREADERMRAVADHADDSSVRRPRLLRDRVDRACWITRG